ncbi:MAG: hypothetical protein H7Z40_09705 [Phycisphaerae bacterium]|nr:hypothetical protein [Gemmatimonadaceae bacterium]
MGTKAIGINAVLLSGYILDRTGTETQSLIPNAMSESADQSFSNHTKWVPLYHFVGTPLVLAVLIWSIRHAIAVQSADSVLLMLMALAIAVQHALVRLFPLKVQDRLIRLEEQLRLQRLLPEHLRPRIGEFTVHQLVAMRFASDDELPQLAANVLEKKITSRKAVKQEIKKWRPDTFRV